MQSASLPAVCPGLSVRECGPWGATCCSTCPVLCHSESGPLSLSVRECRAVGPASGQSACPVRPTLRQSQSRHGHASPLRPGCTSLPLLPVWMYASLLSTLCWTSLPFDFLSALVVRGGAVCLPTPPSWFLFMYASWIQGFMSLINYGKILSFISLDSLLHCNHSL